MEKLSTVHLENNGGHSKEKVKMKMEERIWPRGGGCSSGAGGIMKMVVAVALLLLFSASPLVFFPSSFSVSSSIFVIFWRRLCYGLHTTSDYSWQGTILLPLFVYLLWMFKHCTHFGLHREILMVMVIYVHLCSFRLLIKLELTPCTEYGRIFPMLS